MQNNDLLTSYIRGVSRSLTYVCCFVLLFFAVTNPDGTVTFVIPDHLKMLPTDTEEEKMRKRKKVKHLKSHFKAKEKEEEGNEKQQSWKDYMNKVMHYLEESQAGSRHQ